MKHFILISLTLTFFSQSLMAGWENPAILCPEEILPKGLQCPNLSEVENPNVDFPASMSNDEINLWKTKNAPDLTACRNKEMIRREKQTPGTYTADQIEMAWMMANGGEQSDEKLSAIQSSSEKYGVPPQILIGALTQESKLSSLGVSPDGGNYSCGIAQLNLEEWCEGMNSLSKDEQSKLQWPEINCSEGVKSKLVEPFYNIAIKNLGTRKSYELVSNDFKDIKLSDIYPKLSFNKRAQKKLFDATASFVNHCQDIHLSIAIKAKTLKGLYTDFVPAQLKKSEQYPAGQTFPRACAHPYPIQAYPLHTGWLLAVAMYNAGPSQARLIRHYYQMPDNNFPTLNPQELIEALHWSGKYKEGTDYIAYNKEDGTEVLQRWFKSCVVQRHVARVVQNVTIPGQMIVKSVEQGGCKLTGVPDYRKKSSGIKEN